MLAIQLGVKQSEIKGKYLQYRNKVDERSPCIMCSLGDLLSRSGGVQYIKGDIMSTSSDIS